jgi:putative acetyltransferase
MTIQLDDLRGPEIADLLRMHLRELAAISPPESMHALDIGALRRPDITFWTAWDDGVLAGCGALRELDPHHAEIKSMRTASTHLRRGVASGILGHLIEEARRRGYRRLSLETGSMPAFEPARALYARFGFRACGPFTGYVEDPNSVFLTLEL